MSAPNVPIEVGQRWVRKVPTRNPASTVPVEIIRRVRSYIYPERDDLWCVRRVGRASCESWSASYLYQHYELARAA